MIKILKNYSLLFRLQKNSRQVHGAFLLCCIAVPHAVLIFLVTLVSTPLLLLLLLLLFFLLLLALVFLLFLPHLALVPAPF
jgi:hypothetical protein